VERGAAAESLYIGQTPTAAAALLKCILDETEDAVIRGDPPGSDLVEKQGTMKYEEYASLAHRAAELSEKGDFQGAIATFRTIVDSDLALPDRVMMSLNIATMYARMKQIDNALTWFGTAVELEGRYLGRQALESRAIFLAQVRRDSDSLEEFEKLVKHPSLNEADKARVRGFIQELNGRMGK
jgi:tetratricopeptide (TPR) repeat protein